MHTYRVRGKEPHMNALVPYMATANDPALTGWSPGLPLELALRQQPVKDICKAYGISRQRYDQLRADPAFRRAVEEAIETLEKDDGASFRLKARAQAEELLKTSWTLIHGPPDQVSANVKAQLIQMTIKCAGLDASVEQKAKASAQAVASQMTALQINIHLNDD